MMIFTNRELIINAYKYYELDQPTMDDFTYDRMLHTLIKLEEEHGFRLEQSMTQIVGLSTEKYKSMDLTLNVETKRFITITQDIDIELESLF